MLNCIQHWPKPEGAEEEKVITFGGGYGAGGTFNERSRGVRARMRKVIFIMKVMRVAR
jgi:hypothetical protein